ncbi:PH domain-containing protein [Streptomyces sp. NPDC089424]|uniref:PH domain-containing protein n=1 Tax=Streptomyces sp. NPDC089424 TaxID=3365917 RepID=UPI0037FF7E3D
MDVGPRTVPREYRISSAQIRAMVFAFLGAAITIVAPLLFLEGLPVLARTLGSVGTLGLLGWLLWAVGRCATTADVKALRVRGLVTRRHLAWEDIQALRVEPNPGAGAASNAANVIVSAYGRDGRRLILPFVDDRHVNVEREFAVLQALWFQLRGADWRPDAEAARHIERQTARQSALGCGVAAMFLSIIPITGISLLTVFFDMPEIVNTLVWPWIFLVGPPAVLLLTMYGVYRKTLRQIPPR